jgi:hypothetical protein
MDFDIFYREFELAGTENQKRELLESFLVDNDLNEEEITELLLQIDDMVENDLDSEDAIINIEIEEGQYSLFTCIESIDDYKSGSNYYVKIYDPREFYLGTGIGETDDRIMEMIQLIKPTYWIVTDGGIGTRKSKKIFSNELEFKKYFTKFA